MMHTAQQPKKTINNQNLQQPRKNAHSLSLPFHFKETIPT